MTRDFVTRDGRLRTTLGDRGTGRKRALCYDCQPERDAGVWAKAKHTSPPNGQAICECTVRTCACYVTPFRLRPADGPVAA